MIYSHSIADIGTFFNTFSENNFTFCHFSRPSMGISRCSISRALRQTAESKKIRSNLAKPLAEKRGICYNHTVCVWASDGAPSEVTEMRNKTMKTALQLYTLREGLMDDLTAYLSELKDMGYDGVEPYGLSVDELRLILAEMERVGLEVFSIHINYPDFDVWTDDVMAEFAAKGCRYIPISYLPEERIVGGDLYPEMRENILKFSVRAARHGIKVLYHNRDFDLNAYGDTTKLDALYSDLDASVLNAELDTCWVYTAGYDPLTYFNKYIDRCPVLHLKDCVGEGGHKGFRAVGDGVIDFPPIIEAARAYGTPWLCVEQDAPTEGKTPMACVRDSITYLKTLL